MNWNQAVEAMKAGKRVRQVSESVRTRLEHDIWEEGEGPFMLLPATTVDGQEVMVFACAIRKMPVPPSAEHKAADDWITV